MSVRGQIRGQEWSRQPTSSRSTLISPLFLKYIFTHISSPFVLWPAPTQPFQDCHSLKMVSGSLLLPALVYGPHNSSSMERLTLCATTSPSSSCLHPHTSCLTFPTSPAVFVLHSAFTEGPLSLLSSLPIVSTLLQRANLLCSCLLCQVFTQKQLAERVSLALLFEAYTILVPPHFLHCFFLSLALSVTHSNIHIVPSARTQFHIGRDFSPGCLLAASSTHT
jgi:hypothetical protein